jgi:hypothetical protein
LVSCEAIAPNLPQSGGEGERRNRIPVARRASCLSRGLRLAYRARSFPPRRAARDFPTFDRVASPPRSA